MKSKRERNLEELAERLFPFEEGRFRARGEVEDVEGRRRTDEELLADDARVIEYLHHS